MNEELLQLKEKMHPKFLGEYQTPQVLERKVLEGFTHIALGVGPQTSPLMIFYHRDGNIATQSHTMEDIEMQTSYTQKDFEKFLDNHKIITTSRKNLIDIAIECRQNSPKDNIYK